MNRQNLVNLLNLYIVCAVAHVDICAHVDIKVRYQLDLTFPFPISSMVKPMTMKHIRIFQICQNVKKKRKKENTFFFSVIYNITKTTKKLAKCQYEMKLTFQKQKGFYQAELRCTAAVKISYLLLNLMEIKLKK